MEDVKVLWSPSQPIFAYDDDEECISAVDWLGNRFWVGDMVMYCIGAGRGQVMAVGKVMSIKSEHHERSRTGHTVKGEDQYRSAWDKITVKVLTERTSGLMSNGPRTKPAEVNAINVTWIPQEMLEAGVCKIVDNLNFCQGGPAGPNHVCKHPFII